MCLNPQVYNFYYDYDKNGKVVKRIIWNRYDIENPNKITLFCGKCKECLQKRSNEWADRIFVESQEYEKNTIVTLTYDNEHLPVNNQINYRDVQLFLKRLRKMIAPREIKFFCSCEYGEKFQRPHYHMIIMNYDFEDKTLFKKGKKGSNQYLSSTLEKLWGLGFATCGEFSRDSAFYCCKYLLKPALKVYEELGITPPSVKMSNGIGKKKALSMNPLKDRNLYINGRIRRAPRYFREIWKKFHMIGDEILKMLDNPNYFHNLYCSRGSCVDKWKVRKLYEMTCNEKYREMLFELDSEEDKKHQQLIYTNSQLRI